MQGRDTSMLATMRGIEYQLSYVDEKEGITPLSLSFSLCPQTRLHLCMKENET